MSNETAVVQVQPQQTAVMSMKDITDRVNLVHNVLDKVMRKGTHYGVVPGCGDKKVLLKPGADVLAMTFRLVPQFAVTRTDLPNGHREYDVTCTMYAHDGGMLGQGVGSCSTMEKKYRYRKDSKGGKVENEDISDTYNTVLKMAKKRAHVDATLTVTGAADLFTQDLIDDEEEPQRPPVAMPTPTETTPAKPARKPNTEDQFDNVVTGQIQNIEIATGDINEETKKPAWTKYGITIDGVTYGTFDEKLYLVADKAWQEGKTVELVWRAETRKGKQYRNAVELTAVEAAK